MNNQPILTDDILVAYLDGEADVAAVAIIEAQSDVYADRLAILRSADSDLRQRLTALQPISSFELGQYQLGLATPAEQTRIERYLQQHPHAQRQLAMLDEFLTELEPQPLAQTQTNLLTQAKTFIARLIAGDAPQALAMGLRGAQEGVYEAGDYQVVVESDSDFDDPSRMALSGLLTGHEDDATLVAKLWRADDVRVIGSAEIDQFGNFNFPRLESGRYELIITGATPAVEIHIQDIQI